MSRKGELISVNHNCIRNFINDEIDKREYEKKIEDMFKHIKTLNESVKGLEQELKYFRGQL